MGIVTEPLLNLKKKLQNLEEKDESELVRKIFGGVSIFVAYEANKYTKRILNNKLVEHIENKEIKLNEHAHNKKNVYKKAGYKAYKNSGLAEKGVKILSFKELSELGKPVIRSHNGIPIFGKGIKEFIKDYIESIYEITHQTVVSETMRGRNALYAHSKTEQYLAVNMVKKPYACFHEMGHALNKNSNGFGKILLKTKRLNKLAPLILATAILRKKKPDSETSETVIGRSLDFVKDNCVGLTVLTQVPTLLEEGLASIKGQNLAKPYLPKAQLKHLAKMNGVAWLTYFAGVAAVTAGVFAANKVRNLTSFHTINEND